MMDVSYLSPGAYVPYYRPSRGFVVARSPSPPLSVCSEPILQLPMADGRNGSLAQQQLKTPKMQLLNKTIVDARRKKNAARGYNVATRLEPPDISNFFNSTIPCTDYNSESGSLKSGPDTPKFMYTPTSYFFPSSPYQWQPLDARYRFPQSEEGQMRTIQPVNPQIPANHHSQQPEQNSIQLPILKFENNLNTANIDPRKKMITKRTSNDGNPPSSERVKRKNIENDSTPTPKLSTPKKNKVLSTGKTANASKKVRVKQNFLLRKQRKRIQKKNKTLHKTELCTHWMLTSTCNYKGKCYFAHGLDELRKRVRLSNFKTKPCVDCPPKGRRCFFGARCNYCHPGEAIRRSLSSTYYDIDYYNDLKKDFRNNEYPFGIFI